MISLVGNESDMSLLTFPNSGNNYYYTKIITTNLIEHFGQLKEFRISLKCICFNFVTKVIRKNGNN